MDDSKIVDLYWQRSELAISETAKKYDHYCNQIAFNILSNKEDSKECVNDTYLRAWNSIPENRPTLLSSFLGKITRNLAFNTYKSKRTQKRGGGELELILDELEEIIPSVQSVEDEIEVGELTVFINSFLKSLNKENRVIFVHRYWYSYSISDIAKCYNISESKIKSILFRCRNKLKSHLEREGVRI